MTRRNQIAFEYSSKATHQHYIDLQRYGEQAYHDAHPVVKHKKNASRA
jgi:hypothetical protein